VPLIQFWRARGEKLDSIPFRLNAAGLRTVTGAELEKGRISLLARGGTLW